MIYGLHSASTIRLPYGPSSATGYVRACVDGRSVDVCATTDEVQYFADRACDSVDSSYSELIDGVSSLCSICSNKPYRHRIAVCMHYHKIILHLCYSYETL